VQYTGIVGDCIISINEIIPIARRIQELSGAGNSSSRFQRIGAVFGLAGAAIIIACTIVHAAAATSLADLKPESLVQWSIDNRFVMILSPFMIAGMVFFGVLLEAVAARMAPAAPVAANLGVRFGWTTVVFITLMLLAQWIHIFLNGVVWERDVALQFSRLTYNAVTFLNTASHPFLAGWLLTVGIGSMMTGTFSKALSRVTAILGGAVVYIFFAELLQHFGVPVLPLPLGPVSVLLLAWYSLELWFRAKSGPQNPDDQS